MPRGRSLPPRLGEAREDIEKVVALEEAVVVEVRAVDGVFHHGRAERGPQGLGPQRLGERDVDGPAELPEVGDGGPHLDRDHRTLEAVRDDVLVPDPDALIRGEELVAHLGPERDELETRRLEAAARQFVQQRTDAFLADDVRLDEEQRGRRSSEFQRGRVAARSHRARVDVRRVAGREPRTCAGDGSRCCRCAASAGGGGAANFWPKRASSLAESGDLASAEYPRRRRGVAATSTELSASPRRRRRRIRLREDGSSFDAGGATAVREFGGRGLVALQVDVRGDDDGGRAEGSERGREVGTDVAGRQSPERAQGRERLFQRPDERGQRAPRHDADRRRGRRLLLGVDRRPEVRGAQDFQRRPEHVHRRAREEARPGHVGAPDALHDRFRPVAIQQFQRPVLERVEAVLADELGARVVGLHLEREDLVRRHGSGGLLSLPSGVERSRSGGVGRVRVQRRTGSFGRRGAAKRAERLRLLCPSPKLTREYSVGASGWGCCPSRSACASDARTQG
mmetsp:Transcript_18954/g.59187  ORF Transcript_18954/g.59187 Transcript_18954/m.59187 type:complete len:511 (-) Transcript_18954:81-1613(-)